MVEGAFLLEECCIRRAGEGRDEGRGCCCDTDGWGGGVDGRKMMMAACGNLFSKWMMKSRRKDSGTHVHEALAMFFGAFPDFLIFLTGIERQIYHISIEYFIFILILRAHVLSREVSCGMS